MDIFTPEKRSEVMSRIRGRDTKPELALRSMLHRLGYLNVSKRNLYCWRMAGLVPYFKIGRAVRFRKSELDAALERMRMG